MTRNVTLDFRGGNGGQRDGSHAQETCDVLSCIEAKCCCPLLIEKHLAVTLPPIFAAMLKANACTLTILYFNICGPWHGP